MKAESVGIEERIYYQQKEMTPIAKLAQYVSTGADSSVLVYMSFHQIAANGDTTVSVSESTNTKETWVWDTEGSIGDDLTAKINGDSVAAAIKPLRVISGRLTNLVVTNSDAVNKKQIGIARIVVSDTTNTQLIEVANG